MSRATTFLSALLLFSCCPTALALRVGVGGAVRQRLSGATRREALSTASAAAAALIGLGPLTASRAVAAAPDVNDLSRLKRGLDDVQFLLDNWVRETTDPTSGEMAPDRVRVFLGLRTTDHPLFQVRG